MNIASTQYSLSQTAFEIYISGCKEYPCKGCHNPELWDESIGEKLTNDKLKKIKNKINEFDDLINKIMIYGGEPLEKPINKIIWLLKELKKMKKEIWLFTRFELNEIPKEIIVLCDYIKTGKFDNTQLTNNNIQYGIKLASANQQIHKIKED